MSTNPLSYIPLELLLQEINRRTRWEETRDALPPEIIEIATLTSGIFGVSLEALFSPLRENSLCRARFACWAVIRERTSHSSNAIAGFFHRAEHATILHGVERAREFVRNDKTFARQIQEVLNAIGTPASNAAPSRPEPLKEAKR